MADAKIVCVSANPAMDRRLRVASLAVGAINRAQSAHGYAGGKAAHVAMAAHALAAPVVWIGFLGGSIGEECFQQLQSLGIRALAIPTASSTRVNLEIIEDSGKITEILEPGNEPTAEEKDLWLRTCARELQEELPRALLVISGSLPAGVKPDFYVSLIEGARAANARVFVDTSGEPLRECVKAQPDFIKSNRPEMEGLVGRSLKSLPEILQAAQEVMQTGVGSVAITLGREGLVWAERQNGPVWVSRPPHLSNVISTVGCGDATLAGFACAAVQGLDGESAIRLAAACGAANCSAAAPGRIERATVESLLPQIAVEQLAF